MKSIPHNLTIRPYDRSQWYWTYDEKVGDMQVFTFLHMGKLSHTIRTSVEGWTEQDAESFANWLTGNDIISRRQLENLP